MKKYITVAALLAAGTAFANADVVAVFNCGLSGNTGYMDQTKDWTDVLQSGGGSVISSTEGGNGITLSSAGSVLGGVGAGGSFTVGTPGGTGPYEIPDALKTLSSGVFKDSTYDTLWGGAINLWNAGSATLKLSGLTANTEYTVYLFSARANPHNTTGGFVTWGASEGSPTATWTTYTYNGTSVVSSVPGNSATVQFDGSSEGQNATIVKLEFTTGTEGSFSFDSGTSAKFTLNGMVVDQGSTIPEPSAFGLLAGLGALALVASRRRRK